MMGFRVTVAVCVPMVEPAVVAISTPRDRGVTRSVLDVTPLLNLNQMPLPPSAA